MLADYHIHTNHSDDSKVLIETYIQKALKLGLDEICFTNHVDYGVPKIVDCNIDLYKKDFDLLKTKYENEISIKFGMEFGMQSTFKKMFQDAFDHYDFDFIILSCHCIDGLQLWNNEFQDGKSQKEYNERYYNEILKDIMNYKDYSVLGHLDLIRRYDTSCYPFEKIKDIVTQILKLVIEQGKGIEVNTSCFRYKIPDLTPSLDILKLYKELGGEILTIGSDSHDISHLGTKIKDVHKQLTTLGFKHFYTYDKMKPIKHNLVGEKI